LNYAAAKKRAGHGQPGGWCAHPTKESRKFLPGAGIAQGA